MSLKKFKNKYRIESTRLKGYDYSSNGAYFVTIVTKNRTHYFGEIKNGEMIFSDIGKIVQKYWNKIPQHFQFIKLDEMIIMPNHIHGILRIEKQEEYNVVDTYNLCVSTTMRNKKHKIEWKPGTIGVIINQFKRICTIKSRKIYSNFAWQPRFYDRIIRNKSELKRIRQYIISNPIIWEQDIYNGDYEL